MKEWIITSSVLIIVVCIIRQIFKNRLSARIRYGLWLLVLLRLLIPVTIPTSAVSILNLFPVTENLPDKEIELSEITSGTDLSTLSEMPDIVHDYGNSEAVETANDFVIQENFFQTADGKWYQDIGTVFATKKWMLLWIFGMTGCAVVLIASNLLFAQRLKHSRRIFEIEDRGEGDISLSTPVPVYISEIVTTPCMFGLFHPGIYIRQRDAENAIFLYHILVHECTHYRHKDHIWAFFRSLCLILHWYNPLVWLAAYMSKQDAEFACDESVTSKLSDEKREEYGKVLIALSVKNIRYRDMLCCATTISGGKRYLKERIVRIAKKPCFFVISTTIVLLLCVAAIFLTFTGAVGEKEVEQPGTEVVISETVDVSTPQPSPDTFIEETYATEQKVFVNDYLCDMNGDGIQDILRISGIGMVSEEDTLESEEGLRAWLEGNLGGYFLLELYDGAKAYPDMDSFHKGDTLSEDAIVTSYEPALSHAGNMQLSYYEDGGKGYLIHNCPYFGQGNGDYFYEAYTFDENWHKVTIAEDTISFTTTPYNPAITDSYYTEYLYNEIFDQNKLSHYTIVLKSYLDKAITLIDTSIFGQLLVTTYFEDTEIKPDAFDIWYWDDRLLSEDIDTELALQQVLTIIKKEIVAASSENWDTLGGNDLIQDISISCYFNAPEVNYPASEYTGISEDDWVRLPDNAGDLPWYVVKYACEDVKEYVTTPEEAQFNWYWTDWKITDISWEA
ncbi:MAG: M56 family metallopeptidase, partial [Lachnospiraceae bacterium]